MTNQSILNKYLRRYRHSKQSEAMRKSIIGRFMQEFNKDILTITKQDLLDYFDNLKHINDISLSTKKNRWNIVISFLRWLMEINDAFLVKIPSKSIQWGNNHIRSKRTNANIIMIPEEIESILNYFKDTNSKLYVIFSLFAHTGCRKGELINMSIDDLHIEDRYIEATGKTGYKIYIIPYILKPYLEMYLEERLTIDTEYNNLFLTRWLESYSLRSFNLSLKKATKALGINKNITTKSFRKSLNTHRKRLKNCPHIIAKQLLGHKVSDVNIEAYTIYDIQDLRELSDKYDPYNNLNI